MLESYNTSIIYIDALNEMHNIHRSDSITVTYRKTDICIQRKNLQNCFQKWWNIVTYIPKNNYQLPPVQQSCGS